jgi:hypothetical protein
LNSRLEDELQSKLNEYLCPDSDDQAPIIGKEYKCHDTHSSSLPWFPSTTASTVGKQHFGRIKPDFIITRNDPKYYFTVFAAAIIEVKLDLGPRDSALYRDALNQLSNDAIKIHHSSQLLDRKSLTAILMSKYQYYTFSMHWVADEVIVTLTGISTYDNLSLLIWTLNDENLSSGLNIPKEYSFEEDVLSASIQKKKKSRLTCDSFMWKYSCCGHQMEFPCLIYSSSLSNIFQSGNEYIIKVPSHRSKNFVAFEALAYRRLQRFGIPSIARLEDTYYKQDKKLLVLSTVGDSYVSSNLFVPLVESLQMMHQKTFLVHGDLRPENIVQRGTNLYLIDFAFARDNAPWSFLIPFYKLLKSKVPRRDFYEKIKAFFGELVSEIKEQCQMGPGLFLTESAKEKWLSDFSVYWATMIQRPQCQTLKKAYEDHSRECPQQIGAFENLFEDFKHCFIAFFATMTEAPICDSPSGPIDFLAEEVLGALETASTLNCHPNRCFRGLPRLASNRVLENLYNCVEKISICPADDLESLVKCFLFLRFPDIFKELIAIPQDNAEIILDTWLKFEAAEFLNIRFLLSSARACNYEDVKKQIPLFFPKR